MGPMLQMEPSGWLSHIICNQGAEEQIFVILTTIFSKLTQKESYTNMIPPSHDSKNKLFIIQLNHNCYDLFEDLHHL